MSEFEERIVPGSAAWRRYVGDHLVRYLYAVPFAKDKRVLDAGTGPGYGAALMARSGAKSVHAVDLDPEAIKAAAQRYPTCGVHFTVDDCHILSSVSGPFDLICSFENIEHLSNPDAFLRSASRLLSADGVLLVSTPDRLASAPEVNGRPANPFHMQEWTRPEFSKLLNKYFESIVMLSEVITYGYLSRREAQRAIQNHLLILRRNPIVRCLSWLSGTARSCGTWPSLDSLGDLGVNDLAIVPAELSEAFGTPHCHYAVCRSPHRELPECE